MISVACLISILSFGELVYILNYFRMCWIRIFWRVFGSVDVCKWISAICLWYLTLRNMPILIVHSESVRFLLNSFHVYSVDVINIFAFVKTWLDLLYTWVDLALGLYLVFSWWKVHLGCWWDRFSFGWPQG